MKRDNDFVWAFLITAVLCMLLRYLLTGTLVPVVDVMLWSCIAGVGGIGVWYSIRSVRDAHKKDKEEQEKQ